VKNTRDWFKCPECDSSHFGYSGDDGMCHGETGCHFQWHRRDEWKYFIKVQEYESVEEYGEDCSDPEGVPTHKYEVGQEVLRPGKPYVVRLIEPFAHGGGPAWRWEAYTGDCSWDYETELKPIVTPKQ